MQILHLDSSILADNSASRKLTTAIVRDLIEQYPGAEVVHRDLALESIPHLDGVIAAGFRTTGFSDFGDQVRAEHARSEALVTEFLGSDLIVIGAPMYNFSVPSQLKAWIDRIAQVGRTFRYTETGPVGLSGGRRVIVASSRGGVYSVGPRAVMDFQEAYLRVFFGFLGIADVTFVRAENQSRGPEVSGEAMASAIASIHDIIAPTV